jgi:predicted nucleic acid-binding protein
MTPIVFDSNILFSSLRSKDSTLLSLIEMQQGFAFYTPNFLVVEIFKHRERLRAKSKLTEDEFLEVLSILLRSIRFYNESMISGGSLVEAWRLVRDIDPKDHLFVALALELEHVGEFFGE